MSELQDKKMPKGYAVMWIIITAVYGVWMTFFMKALFSSSSGYADMLSLMTVSARSERNVPSMPIILP